MEGLAMLSILDLSVAFPNREQRVEEAAAELGLSPMELKMFKRYYSFDLFRVDNTQTLVGLLDTAMSSLIARHPQLRTELRIVAHCHTISDITVFGPGALEWLRDRHVAYSTEVMSLTMNHCAIGVSMFKFMDAFLAAGELGVLLIGEKAFHRTVRLIENTSIMGEAAAAILVGHGDGILKYLGGYTTHEGEYSVISGDPSGGSVVGFGAAYYDLMVRHIREALSNQNVGIDDIRYIFPHNVNTASWRRIANSLEIPPEKIYLQNIARYGHCFGADPFVSVLDAFDQDSLAVGDTVLLISAGLGGTVATALMRVTALPARSQARTRRTVSAVPGEG
jgi:3-oxoacyl-[acyl-carrier-protein] synthase-3